MASISEISFSQLNKRLDSEYYRPEYLEIERKLEDCGYELKKLQDIVAQPITDGDHGITRFVDHGVPFLRIDNVTKYRLNLRDVKFIKREHHMRLKRSQLQPRDIVLTKTGTVGIALVFPEGVGECNTSAELARIVLEMDWVPEYVASYLNSNFGQMQIRRRNIGGGRPHLTLSNINLIKIPRVPREFQHRIAHMMRQASAKEELADAKYEKAKRSLLRLFNADKLELPEKNIYETKFSQMKESRRVDAEYYSPKYEQIIQVIENAGYKVRKLKDAIRVSKKTLDPTQQPDEKFRYVEIANVNALTGVIVDYEQIIGHKAPGRARMLLRKGDVLVSSLRGSLDNIAVVPEELDRSVGSTGFFVISSDSFYSEFLFLLFKTKLIKEQMEQKTTGTIMAALKQSDLEDVLVPLVPKHKQSKISTLVRESFALRRGSQNLIQKTLHEIVSFLETD